MKILPNFIFLIMVPFWALADSPIQISKVEICPDQGRFCIVSDPAEGFTKVVSKADGKQKWSVPGWHPWIFVSNNGLYGAIGYDGMNLVPINVSLDEVMFDIYRDGILIRKLLLSDFYKNIEQMPLTSSHRVWMNSAHFSKENSLVVELVDGSIMRFEIDEK